MQRAYVAGTGSYIPETIVTNYDLMSMMPTTHEWIVAHTGIIERRVAPKGVSTSDMAIAAARQALDAADVAPADLDLILVATSTPDYPLPATAAIVQDKLSATRAVGFDLNAVCSGFIYGLVTAESYLRSGLARTALVIGADTYSRIINWSDRTTAPFFGDGAGAVVLSTTENGSGILGFDLGMTGSGAGAIIVPAGGVRCPIDATVLASGKQYFHMDGRAVYEFATRTWPASVQSLLRRVQLRVEDINLIVPHQANLRILEHGAAALGVGMERLYVTLERFGNTAGASIPMALDSAVRQDKTRSGDLLILVGFGGGLSWGSVAIRW